MSIIKYERGFIQNVLTTELNGLANVTSVLSAAIDNSTALNFFDDLVLSIGNIGSNRDAGAIVELFLLEALDDTNFVDGAVSIEPAQSDMVGVFNIRASTAAQVHVVRGVALPPTKYKYLVKNKTGQALSVINNTLERRPYAYQSGG